MENELQIQQQNFEDCIIFMSKYNDTDLKAKDNTSRCLENSSRVSGYAKKFLMGQWTFLGPGDEDKWYGTLTHKPNGEWNRKAEKMIVNFVESGHLELRGTSPLSSGSLKSKGRGKVSIHFNMGPQTAELLFRTVLAVQQLSI